MDSRVQTGQELGQVEASARRLKLPGRVTSSDSTIGAGAMVVTEDTNHHSL
ncbi:MAG TPA: hypothetical protein VK706_02350 [Candidatus Sulfotelmatobacter sp.]|jgi:hypothetical protein|nr:hypothetical protein [Candidatus Sulfotelmatobacter sp.]